MRSTGVALLVWALLAQNPPAVPPDDLTAARELYASGDYEQALTRLSKASDDKAADEIDKYRALCLLALGRTAETERSLQQLITRRPLFKMSETDVSPRLVTIFHDVRRRLLPGIAREMYGNAKLSFDQKKFT